MSTEQRIGELEREVGVAIRGLASGMTRVDTKSVTAYWVGDLIRIDIKSPMLPMTEGER